MYDRTGPPPNFDQACGAFLGQRRLRIPDHLRTKGWVLVQAGSDGFGTLDHPRRQLRVIDSISRELDDHVWLHISVSRYDGRMPTWAMMRDTWWDFAPKLKGVIVLAPEDEHISGKDLTKVEVGHAWGCLTGFSPVPDFSRGLGSI